MKKASASLLIVVVLTLAAVQAAAPVASNPMGPGQLAAARGAGFWGGAVCGAAAGLVTTGVMAAVGALGAGTTIPLGVAFGISAGAHILAVCLML